MDALTSKYKEWLVEAGAGEDDARDEPSSEITEKLARMASFASHDKEMMSDLLGYYSEVRSNYMMTNLHAFFRNIDAPVKGTYQHGSHPFIIALREFFKMAQRESVFAARVLPPATIPDTVRRSAKHPADLVNMSAEAVAAKVSKALAKHEFVDQIWIFDIVEASNDMYVACPSPTIQEMVQPAIKAVTAASVDLLKSLIDDVQGTSRSTVTLTASANATVFEQTSSVLNCLKRMLEYERIIETLLNCWGQKDKWDGIIGPITSDTTVFAMALYYQDLLKGLEVLIEKYSHGYKRPMTSVLFQLNNYNYIVHTFKSSALASMVTMEAERKYESIVEALVNEYLLGWKHLISLIEDGSQRSVGLAPRDRLKVWWAGNSLMGF